MGLHFAPTCSEPRPCVLVRLCAGAERASGMASIRWFLQFIPQQSFEGLIAQQVGCGAAQPQLPALPLMPRLPHTPR